MLHPHAPGWVRAASHPPDLIHNVGLLQRAQLRNVCHLAKPEAGISGLGAQERLGAQPL